MKVSENTEVSLPLRNLLSIIGAVAIGVWAYFGVVETLNKHSTRLELMGSDLEKNTEFRIKWPRGEMGSLPADSEQFIMNTSNKLRIEFMEKQITKMLNDIEKLKDANREIKFGNGNGKNH
jgi:hypothetical protein